MALTADDRLAILDLLARYNWAIDGRLPDAADAWADTFTEDGCFELRGDLPAGAADAEGAAFVATVVGSAQGGDGALVSLRGRAALRAFADTVQRSRPRPGFHWVDNVVIEGGGDGASMACYLRAVLARTNDAPEEVTVNGYYRDRLRKVDGQWKFERRLVVVT